MGKWKHLLQPFFPTYWSRRRNSIPENPRPRGISKGSRLVSSLQKFHGVANIAIPIRMKNDGYSLVLIQAKNSHSQASLTRSVKQAAKTSIHNSLKSSEHMGPCFGVTMNILQRSFDESPEKNIGADICGASSTRPSPRASQNSGNNGSLVSLVIGHDPTVYPSLHPMDSEDWSSPGSSGAVSKSLI